MGSVPKGIESLAAPNFKKSAIALAMGLAVIGDAHGATIMVNTNIDRSTFATQGGTCTLRKAIQSVNLANTTLGFPSFIISGCIAVGPFDSNNTIIADSNGDNCVLNGANINADSESIIESNYCGGGVRDLDPGLLPLRDNGGVTLTHALSLDSQAVNTSNNGTCASNDQRGNVRKNTITDPCDVGAFEQNDRDRAALSDSFFVVPLQNGTTVIFGLLSNGVRFINGINDEVGFENIA